MMITPSTLSRKRRSSVYRYAPVMAAAQRFAGDFAGAGRNIRRRLARSRTRSRTSTSSGAEPPAVSGDHDVRTVYRRKSFPRRRKRSWIRFKRKVRAIQFKDLAPNFANFAYGGSFASSDGKQAVTSLFTVMGFHGAGEEANDVGRLWGFVPGTGVGTVGESSTLRITGWNAECVISNNNEWPCFVDCYYWYCHRNTPTGSGGASPATAAGLFSDGLASYVSNFPSGGSTMDSFDYGVTPFQSLKFGSYLKVYKKVRLQIAGLGTAQIALRSGKDIKLRYETNENLIFKKGLSKGVLMIWYGSPTNSAGQDISRGTSLSLGINKMFTYRVVMPNYTTAGADNA